MDFFGIFKKTPERQAAEAEQNVHVSVNALRVRHQDRLLQAAFLGLDPATLLLLIQFFGPLAVALIDLLLKRLAAPRTAESR